MLAAWAVICPAAFASTPLAWALAAITTFQTAAPTIIWLANP
jgi:hypothetical protein